MLNLIKKKYQDGSILNLTILTSITLLFWLLHTNQSSSQSAATLLLLLTPLCLLFIKDTKIPQQNILILTIASILFFTVYNFLILTQHEFNKDSLTSFRALFFWLIFPIASIIIWKVKPSKKWVFITFSLAAIFSISPVIRDHLLNVQRGHSSGHPIFWGNIALCSGIIAFALRKSATTAKWGSIVGYIALICGLIASFWSQTRGGWISIPLSFVILFTYKSISKKQAVFITLALSIVIFNTPTIENRLKRTFQVSNIFTEEIKLDRSTQVRLDMWGAAIEIFKQKPLLGGGFETYQSRALELIEQGEFKKNIAYYKQPHSEYLNILVTSGIVGFLALAAIIGLMLYIFMSMRKNSAYKLAGLLLISQFLVFSISEVFFSTKLTIVYFCVASALIIYLGLNEHEDSELNDQQA